MEHVAIMKKSWGLTEKILSGEKKIESRWYKSRSAPWDRLKAGEIVYFKDAGDAVKIKASVDRVLQFSDLTPSDVQRLLKKYGRDDGIGLEDIKTYYELFKNKRYCILIFLKNPKKVEPFYINKEGFGISSAWLCVDKINNIKYGVHN